jgi:hypothetical protein
VLPEVAAAVVARDVVGEDVEGEGCLARTVLCVGGAEDVV